MACRGAVSNPAQLAGAQGKLVLKFPGPKFEISNLEGCSHGLDARARLDHSR